MASVGSKKRHQFSNADRHLICKIAQEHPVWTHYQVASEAGKQLGIPSLSRPSVTKILKESAKWLEAGAAESSVKRQRGGQWEKLERTVVEWFGQVTARNGNINDSVLRAKALELAPKLDITDFQCSNGWLANFKKRHGIKMVTPHGESGAADAAGISLARTVVPVAIEELGYDMEDVFNFDETALFFRARPSKTLATGPVEGKKMQKERITLGLCTNVTGTHRLKPVVISKAWKPRAFGKTWQPEDLCYWFANKKAWMTSQVFTEWLTSVNKTMSMTKRRILILMDNAASHVFTGKAQHSEIQGLKCIELSYVRVIFLAPNTTSHVQPLDAGIIAAFKCHYRGLLLGWLVQEFEADPSRDLAKVLPNIKQAIIWSVEAWGQIKDVSIGNCWRHTGILPAAWNAELGATTSDEHEKEAAASAINNLGNMIALLEDRDQMSATEYIEFEGENETERELRDEEVIELAQSGRDDGEPEEENDLEAEATVVAPTLAEFRDFLKGATVFVAENGNFSVEDQLAIARISNKVSRMIVANLAKRKQQSILAYLSSS